ncbi:MAG: NAD(P)/FAD-dependent oxidoreductase [Hyphomicrobiaceae bacterium]
MSPRSVDVIVIGAGPAGLTAAAVVAAAGLSCVAVDRMGPGGQLMNLGDLVGVDDMAPGVMGPDLVGTLTEKAMEAGAELAIDEVARVAKAGSSWVVEGSDEAWSARVVVVASGLTPGTTGLAGEARFEGQGLSHCAHCDAPLYSGREVVVVGRDRWAVAEAVELAAYAGRVTLVTGDGAALGSDEAASLGAFGNVETLAGTVTGLVGDGPLEAVDVTVGGRAMSVPASGLFLQCGRVPALAFVGSDAAPGLILAGDVRDGAARTIAAAIADGERAGREAVGLVGRAGSA